MEFLSASYSDHSHEVRDADRVATRPKIFLDHPGYWSSVLEKSKIIGKVWPWVIFLVRGLTLHGIRCILSNPRAKGLLRVTQ